jgi:Ca-activated chloride channel homolog
VLSELAAQSGGEALFPEGADEVVYAAERIAVELRHQYVVGFSPGEAGDGRAEWRKVKIKVTPPSKKIKGATARSRAGYFLPRAGD